MAVTPVPSITDIPSFPSLADRAAGTYNGKAFAFGTHMSDTFNAELTAVAQNVHDNAVDAAESATDAEAAKVDAQSAATSAAATAGATKWVSGAYAEGAAAWSLIDGQTYRRKAPGGASPTDPANDPTNWYAVGAPATLAGKTLVNPTIEGCVTEDIYAIVGTTPVLNPANGQVQIWALTGNSAPTEAFVNGQSATLMIDDGTAYTITWGTLVTWVGGSAPTLATSGYTVLELWKVGGKLYGAKAGEVA